MGYFKKHWSTKLQEEVLKCVEEEVYLSSHLPFWELSTFSSKNGGYDCIVVPRQRDQYYQRRARVCVLCFENSMTMKKTTRQIQGWMCQMILNGHGFATTKPIWMFLSKCQKAGRQSSGGV
jgi:hypothetical protein